MGGVGRQGQESNSVATSCGLRDGLRQSGRCLRRGVYGPSEDGPFLFVVGMRIGEALVALPEA